MDLQLTGKRVLVTGASRGIGLEIVRAFTAEGAEVVASARRSTPELDATGATFVPADLSTPDGPRRLAGAVLSADPRLDVLVNNAGGGSISDEDFDDPFGGGDEAWASTFALNFDSVVRLTRATLPALAAARGAVVSIGSEAARRETGEPMHYSAAKAALHRFSRGLAERVAPSGVRVNVVSPAGVHTPLLTSQDGYGGQLAARFGVDLETFVAAMPKQAGMLTDGLIHPSEIARTVLLLASPAMSSAIGQIWGVHGGADKAA